MSSREEFMRQMGISMDDVTDPSNIKTKFPSKVSMSEPAVPDRAPPPPPRSTASYATSKPAPQPTRSTPTGAGYMSYAEEFREPQMSPMKAAAPTMKSAASSHKAGGNSAREDFLRSLGIDNMDAPPAPTGQPQPAVASRASQEYARPGARPAALSSVDSEDSTEGYRTMAPKQQPDVTLGMRRTSSNMLPATNSSSPTPSGTNKAVNKPYSMMEKELEGLTVEEVKNLGNKSFEEGDYRKAVRLYSRAIEMDPRSAPLYSNRSACYLQASKQMGIDTRTMALRDAEKVIEIRPDWFKGYSRKGDALFKLERFSEAAVAYERGLALDPTNANLMHSLGEARNAAGGVGPRTQSNSWSTKAAAVNNSESLRSATGKSARVLLEEMKASMRRESPNCIPIGDEYREAELQRYREQRSTSSMEYSRTNNANNSTSQYGSSSPTQDEYRESSRSRLDRSQIPQEFSSSVASAYQQSLLEEYRRKKAAKSTSAVYQTY